MNPWLLFSIYLGLTWAGVVVAQVLVYQRPRLSKNLSYLLNWLIVGLMFLGIPWLILFKLIRQENWVNQLLLYFQLQRLTIYPSPSVHELFNAWQQQHIVATRKSRASPNNGFDGVASEQVHWLSTRQVLAGYAFAKPMSLTDAQAGIEYLQNHHSNIGGYYFSEKICLVRTGPTEFGVYEESVTMY